MLTLTKINIFPVKSLDGYSPNSAIVEKQGLQYDRRWMITDLNGLFMTLRNNGRMALLKAVVENDILTIFEKENLKNHVKSLFLVNILRGSYRMTKSKPKFGTTACRLSSLIGMRMNF